MAQQQQPQPDQPRRLTIAALHAVDHSLGVGIPGVVAPRSELKAGQHGPVGIGITITRGDPYYVVTYTAPSGEGVVFVPVSCAIGVLG